MNVQDDLYLGSGFNLSGGRVPNPTLNQGCGPMGRSVFRDIVPLTKQAANIAALQNALLNTAMTLTAGTGATAGIAPDGSGRAVIVLDVARAVAIVSTADFSAVTFTIRGFDEYGQAMTQTRVGPNNATVNTLKAFKSILSVTPGTAVASNVSIGTADIFGLPFAATDAGYVFSAKWAGALAQDAGTFVAGVATIPSTAALGDVRGTYVPSSASDGAKRLVIGQHLIGGQCGPTAQMFTNANQTGAIGVPQV